MSRFVFFVIAASVAGGFTAAAPVPADVKVLVAGLSDQSARARDEATAVLRGRADALPWLRRAARSKDADTARRAAALLAPHEPKRQAEAAKAIDACIKAGRVDLFMEWHHYWQPENKDDLWPVGPRMVRVAHEEWARWCPPDLEKPFERMRQMLTHEISLGFKPRSYDGPWAQRPRTSKEGVLPRTSWSIRTDLWIEKSPRYDELTFASVAGPVEQGGPGGGRFFVLGPVQAYPPSNAAPFVVCDGDVYNGVSNGSGVPRWGTTSSSFVVCRGNFRGGGVIASALLVDGDVELFKDGLDEAVRDSLIRASGEIHIPKNVKVVNSTIEPRAKNAAAPYKFFELSEVELSLVDDEEGLVVADVTPDTPFGNGGLRKGDIIRAIDDVAPGHTSEFRRKVRKAMVVQGDCLLTVARGNTTLDLPVFFPLPK